MSLVSINRDPSRRELVVFSAGWVVFFSLLGGVMLSRYDSWAGAVVLWAVGGSLPLLGALLPGVLRTAFLGASCATLPIGWVVSHTVLAVTYYLVLTPIGLVMRWLGHDPLQRNFQSRADTYWVARGGSPTADRYFRQF